MLLPLDVLKIKMQSVSFVCIDPLLVSLTRALRRTNPEAFRGRGVLQIVKDEGFGLYRGAGWTAARNAPGSFAVSAASTSRP